MKRLTFLLLLFGTISITAQHQFPHAWEGIWKGDLETFNEKGQNQVVPMELHILPSDTSDTYSWTLIYGEDKEKDKRPYELITIDSTRGIYAIDEHNSIFLEGYYLDDTFYQRFSVMGSLLMVSNRVEGDSMYYEILVGKEAAHKETGNTKIEGEDIPLVKSFPISGVQKAVLRKQ